MQVCDVHTLIITRDLTCTKKKLLFHHEQVHHRAFLSTFPAFHGFQHSLIVQVIWRDPLPLQAVGRIFPPPLLHTHLLHVTLIQSHKPQFFTSSLSSLVRIERCSDVSVLLSFCLTPAVHFQAPLNDDASYRLWACSCSDCRETWRLEGIAGYAWLRLGPKLSCWWSRGRKKKGWNQGKWVGRCVRQHASSRIPHPLQTHTLNHHGL